MDSGNPRVKTFGKQSAKTLSERFGNVLQKLKSLTINRQDKSTSISAQLDSLIPASMISNLTQEMFVLAVSDNFDKRIEQKISHAEVVEYNKKVSTEAKDYEKLPMIADFIDEDGNDTMQADIEINYSQIKNEVKQIVVNELKRIGEGENLKYLIKK